MERLSTDLYKLIEESDLLNQELIGMMKALGY
jgi:hypothetical protein